VEDFRKSAEQFAGASLSGFFGKYVYGVDTLPWGEALGYAGLLLKTKENTSKPWLGLSAADAGEKTRVTRVAAHSPAAEAGLDPGDEILALNGTRVRSSELQERVNDFPVGGKITLTVFRNDKLREFTLTLAAQPNATYTVARTDRPTPLQQRIYEGWLHAAWPAPAKTDTAPATKNK
jgi:predicted metalloprotease with PDZ domain